MWMESSAVECLRPFLERACAPETASQGEASRMAHSESHSARGPLTQGYFQNRHAEWVGVEKDQSAFGGVKGH